MKTNLSSQISLHRVSPRYYRPENAFEKSVLTTQEEQEQRFAVTYKVTGGLLLKLSV